MRRSQRDSMLTGWLCLPLVLTFTVLPGCSRPAAESLGDGGEERQETPRGGEEAPPPERPTVAETPAPDAVGTGDKVLYQIPVPRQRSAAEFRTPGEISELYALSLKALQVRLDTCNSGDNCTDEDRLLGKIRRLLGYAVDETGGDILLLGFDDPEWPAARVDDFVVALRNAWLRYAPLEDNVYQYRYPGCDIRPDGSIVERLQELKPKFADAMESEMEAMIDEWRQICESPQQVSVLGVPFDTHFGKVMVQADYDMKSLADGTDKLQLPGFRSLADMRLDRLRQAVVGGEEQTSESGMSRFWLAPGENHYVENDGVVLIRDSPVRVETNPSALDASGELVDTQTTDPLADQWVESFSALYGRIADRRPIYRHLESLFRIFAVAKILHFRNADETAGLDLSYFLDRFPVAVETVERQLPGRYSLLEFEHSWEEGNVRNSVKSWLPGCGGVSMNVEPEEKDFEPDRSGLLPGLKDEVLAARPSPGAVSHPVPVVPGSTLSGLAETQRLQGINRESTSWVMSLVRTGSTYRLYDGETQTVYDHLQVAEIVADVAARLETADTSTVYLEVEGFDDNQVRNFTATSEIQAAQSHPGILFRPLPDIAKTGSEEVLFRPGIELEKISATPVPVTGDSFQGWVQTTVELLVWVRDQIVRVTVVILARSPEVVQAFAARIEARFADWDMVPISLIELLSRERERFFAEELYRQYEKDGNEGQFKIQVRELGGTHFVDLAISRKTAAA